LSLAPATPAPPPLPLHAALPIFEAYLPQQVSEGDLRAAAQEIVAAQALAGPQGIGPAMKAMLQRFGATADGGTINRIVRELLIRSEEHTSELQSLTNLVCRLLLE